ncbi:AAA family ATPase [Eubacterium sp.]|uniref:AAA family ATPase n=1 Tax=Eubacterium sp. TaxID=142586 RepID=UPI0025BACB80|nr:AAA family ATPase [Eubacterium sp.]MCI7800418.1 AAA family ATPase [Eubacterium sp.]
MNSVLQDKLNELQNANDYECWYLVKQPTAFDNICYLVSFLKEFKSKSTPENLQDFIGKKIVEVNASKPNIEISNNYRALRVAAFFGLITMTSSKYEEAIITETFEEINNRCGGAFENKELYEDIIQRQIEKMYISSNVDEGHNGVRQEFRLYPVMLLYKVLLELGRSTGKYKISMTEYRYLVATTKVFENFLETLLLIKLLREDTSANAEFEQYRTKFDNRLIQALKQLPTLIIDRDSISINPDAVGEVAKKIFIFESNPNIFATENYLGFLGSTKSLFELDEFEGENTIDDVQNSETVNYDEVPRIDKGTNVLLYGVPGSGKSWTIEHEYCKPGTQVERLVFHPDYTNADFIGQILPVVDPVDKMVTYEFTPGPFTNILKEAYNNPSKSYVLIIEEINRGNAPAIFGDVFQLLDRTVETKVMDGVSYPRGTSEYGITNENIAKVVYDDGKHKVRIPSNLSILGTMNTSDQNVFTLDTAFQRRWNMRLIENNFNNVRGSLANAEILDTKVTWQKFCETVNTIIIGNRAKMASAEDKRLGVYFVHEQDLEFDSKALPTGDFVSTYDELNDLVRHELLGTLDATKKARLEEMRTAILHNRLFPEKVIKYLWDDAFKFNPEAIFDTENMDSLEKVIRTFVYSKGADRFKIFKQNVRDTLYPTQQ